jgi:DNA-binding PucR family transcriptional regulator
VGGVHDPGNGGVADSFEEAQEALRVALLGAQGQGVRSFADLGLLHWLYHLPADVAADNRYLALVRMLADHDQEREADLVKTLAAYLDHGGSLVDAAEALFVHRNTLLHRVQRIEELLELDLRDPQTRLNLHVALNYFTLRG